MTDTYFASQEEMDNAFEKHMELLQDISVMKEAIEEAEREVGYKHYELEEANSNLEELQEDLERVYEKNRS